MTRIVIIAAAALTLAAAPSAAAAKLEACGSYSKKDGSLASQVVSNIDVVGLSCAGGETVANGYHGLIGRFRAYGFNCYGYQANHPAQVPGVVRCAKGRRRASYTTDPMTECTSALGPPANTPFTGLWSYNVSCAGAAAVQNVGSGGSAPPGWNCPGVSDFFGSQFACSMRSGRTYDVVQWAGSPSTNP